MDCYYDEDDDYMGDETDEYEVDGGGDEYADMADDVVKDKEAVDRITEKNFVVLKAADIRKRVEDEIAKVSSILFVSKEAATILLCRYKWDVDKISEEWFTNEEEVRKDAGLLENCSTHDPSIKRFSCGICLDNHSYRYSGVRVGCGHLFCKPCWKRYISVSINDGHGCLMLRCPEPKCTAGIGQDLIYSLASEKDKDKYDNYLVRSYIEERNMTKWCPGPGCDFAIDYVVGSHSNGRNFDVTCNCKHGFCWNCLVEAHSPADCETTAKWIMKNSSESENTRWILAYTKLCPKCKKPIEKNHGCMHMTCRCKHEFCWLCLGPSLAHVDSTCNSYVQAKERGEYNEDERKRQMARHSLEKYTHYYERWAGNEKSWKKALADMKLMETEHIKNLSEGRGVPETELEFIIHAWRQIVECRRVLKWTYTYGYYLADKQQMKKQLFEHMQGQAEAALERLHHCAETELEKYFDKEEFHPDADQFNDFRHKLVNLTGVTGNYFDNLNEAIGKDLILNCQVVVE